MKTNVNIFNALNESFNESMKSRKESALTEGIEEISKDLCANKDTFKYQMLSRLQNDCEYFLKAGNRNPDVLWAKNVDDHIKLMKDLYNSFGEYDKPEWITLDEIEEYEKEMKDELTENAVNKSEEFFGHSLEDDIDEYEGPVPFDRFLQRAIDFGVEDEVFEKYGSRSRTNVNKLVREYYKDYKAKMNQVMKDNNLTEDAKTVKEFRIMDGDKVLKVFSADQENEGYSEMRRMGKELKEKGLPDNLIYKEFRVKNKSKENDLAESSISDIKDKLDKYNQEEYDKYEIIADTEADKMIKEYFNGDFDLAELHSKLEEYFGSKEKAAKYLIAREKEIKKSLHEEEIVEVPAVDADPDYIIADVTVLDNSTDGDVQSPDIDAMLTLVNESLTEEYGKEWGHINILSTNKTNESSFALVDITTKEILKEFEDKGLQDIAIGKSLILENADRGMLKFKVNSLAGFTRYSKITEDAKATIKEWIESEFLQEAKKEKIEAETVAKAKEQKEVTEEYINNRPELKAEIENIKMFIELSKQVSASEEMKPSIQKRMYAFVAELPQSIEIDEKKGLSFSNRDQAVEQIFGKEWVEETEEIPEVKELKESYTQFNIGDIEVVFNPETYECLYSIPSAEVKDKKINLTKIPSVDTPYDTNTIIKQYIETKFGVIPTDTEEPAENTDLPAETTEPAVDDTTATEPAVNDTEVQEAELPQEPAEDATPADTEVDVDINDIEKDTQESQAETGKAVFVKIRPHQTANLYDIREKSLESDTPASEYIVVGHKDLTDEEWTQFTDHLNEPQEWLSGVQAIDRKNYSFNVLEVTSSAVDYSLLVDPLGYSYARYIGIKQ